MKKDSEKLPNAKKKIEQQKKTNSSHLINNGKKNSISFNLASQLIVSYPYHFKNIFDNFYEEKVTNACVI